MWIGLTGGIATGKSEVAKLLKARGVPVIDADEISRALTKKGELGYQKVIDNFGQDYLGPDQELDRLELGKLIFTSSVARETLENLLHPLIQEKVLKQKEALCKLGHQIIFYDVPLLFEKKMERQFDRTVLVYCSEDLQVARLMKRNSFTLDEASARIKAQLPMSQKRLKADYPIDNSGDLKDLERKIEELIFSLKKDLKTI